MKLKKFILSIIIIFIIIFIFIFKYIFITRYYINDTIIVRSGDTITKIYEKYNIKYNIIDKIIFKYFVTKKLPIGRYDYIINITKAELINKLFHSKEGKQRIILTIHEGDTNEKVFNNIESLGLSTKKEILNVMKNYNFYYPHSENFEGYFLPSTYYFNSGDLPEEIIRKILDEFLKQFPPEEYKYKEKFYNNLILASIVEAETQNPLETQKVAGVFKHRLKIDKKLESDATLRYVLENNRQALRSDLKTNMSEYNTYKHKGLTPTPIGNPSKRTIIDTEKAPISPYLYFFEHRKKIYYSKTHKEHLRKRNQF